MTITQRKFLLVSFFSIVGTIGMFTDTLSATFITFSGLILSFYFTANVAQKAIMDKEK